MSFLLSIAIGICIGLATQSTPWGLAAFLICSLFSRIGYKIWENLEDLTNVVRHHGFGQANAIDKLTRAIKDQTEATEDMFDSLNGPKS